MQANRDPVFLTGARPPQLPITMETLVRLTIHAVKDKTCDQGAFLGSATFSLGELLTHQHLTVNLRSSDGVSVAGEVVVTHLKMGEMEEGDVEHITADMQGQKCSLVCESASHGTSNDKDTVPLSGPVFKNPVCRVYRFQTVDSRWMLVREQMEESTLSFSIPKQLLSLCIQEDTRRSHALRDLGELSPHWDHLRREVMARYDHITHSYQETLTELEKITGPYFKPSCSKTQKYLEFIPINLHTQRMRVTCPRTTDACYDVVTVGAPAAHSQGFKAGGLRSLLSRYHADKKSLSSVYQCIYFSAEHTAQAQEMLGQVGELQPLVSSLAEQLLQAAHQHSSSGLRDALQPLAEKTEQFVHALKEELVKSALLALHAARPASYMTQNQIQNQDQDQDQDHTPPGQHHQAPATPAQAQSPVGPGNPSMGPGNPSMGPGNPSMGPGNPSMGPGSPATPASGSPVVCNNIAGSETHPGGLEDKLQLTHQDSIPPHREYDEEEWDRVWASVAKSLHCVIAMVDMILEQDQVQPIPDQTLADVITSHSPAGDWCEQLRPLVARLQRSVGEVGHRAVGALSFVLLQEAVCSAPQGLLLQQRRDIVFSQALAALACGFVMRLYAGVKDQAFLRQLHLVGILAQFESLLSTYSEEVGMLEDMDVGISDLQHVTFKITQARTDQPSDLQPLLSGRRDHYTVEVPLPQGAFQALPGEIREGQPLQVHPVLFNVGINEQQTIAERFGDSSLQERINQRNFEILDAYYKSVKEKVPSEDLPHFQTQSDLKELLETLGQNVITKKRKNVEILWLAGAICRRMNGIRFTSCKSAKDRTSMSVTLEQCTLLRNEHQLNKDHFVRALDCMRREGCRIQNVHKNIGCRKYAFNVLQLLAFPRGYRPPEGTYGRGDS